MTGFSAVVRRGIKNRSGGMCERCGITEGVQAHHRRNRAMGGSRRGSTNVASNAGWLCVWCHTWITEHPQVGRREGWVVRQTEDPATVPVWYRGEWKLLDDNGGKSGGD